MKKLQTISLIICFFIPLWGAGGLLFATTYTWNGAASTDWATSTNWTPNGTPGSGDNVIIVTTGNQPLYDGVAGVTNFTMTSGTLDLGGYTLDVTGTLACNGGTISNGTLNGTGSSSTFSGTTFGAKVTINSANVYLHGSTFNNNVTVVKTGSSNNTSAGGNVFNDTASISLTGSGFMSCGSSSPDTFNYAAYLSTSSYYLIMASNAAHTYFAGDVYISCTGSGANGVVCTYNGTSHFMGNIYVANSNSSGAITFGQVGGAATLASGKTIIEDVAGFTAGGLYLYSFTKSGTTPINLDFGTGASLYFGGSSVINGAITYRGSNFYLNGATFNNDVSLKKVGSSNDYSSGGNVFNGSATFIDSTTSHIYLANTTGDDFNGNVTFTQPLSGRIWPGYNGTSTWAGNITATGSSTLEFGYGSTVCRNVFDGSAVQVINGAVPSFRFKKLKLDKPAGHISLESAFSVATSDSLVFVKGIMKTNDLSAFTAQDNCIVVGASDSSYVEGAMAKKGDDAFVFPSGRNGHYRPIAMSAPGNVTDIFAAVYYDHNSDDDLSHSSRDGSIAGLSRSEFWYLVRYLGTSDVSVTLSWDTTETSCSFADKNDLTVAAWNGSQWKDKGNGGTTGNLAAGTIVTSGASNVYGVYTLGTVASFSCKPGVSCTDAAGLGTGDTCTTGLTLLNGNMWFSFTADSANTRFTFDDIDNFEMDTVLVFDACGGDTMQTFYYDAGSSIRVEAYDLDISSTYLVEIKGASTGTPATTDFCYNSFLNSRYWVGSGNWNNTANWSTTSGGAGGAGVPHSLDVVKYDNNGVSNCTINAAANVAGVRLSGYSGTISQGSNTVQVGTHGYTMGGGTFNGGTEKIDVNGNFKVTGGTFTATSDTLELGWNDSDSLYFHHTGGTFNHNNGTTFFNVECTTCDYAVNIIPQTGFYDLTFNNDQGTGRTRISSADTVDVENKFRLTAGYLNGGHAWADDELLMTNDFKGGSTAFFHRGAGVNVVTWKGRQSGLTGTLTFKKE